MKLLLCAVLLAVGLNGLRADAPDAQPVGILILKAVPGYDAAATTFVSIQWVDRYSGYVVDKAGTKTVFLNDAIGRVIYFDPVYYEELDHDQNWIEWRAGVRNREAVMPPIGTTNLRPEDLPRLQSEESILEDAIGRYSIGTSLIAPLITTLQDQIAKLSSGLVLQNGAWIAAKDAAAATSAVPVVGDAEARVTFTTKNGKRFENAKVAVTDTGLSVLTDDGGASVDFDQLPDNIAVFPATIQGKITAGRQKAEALATLANAPATEETGSAAATRTPASSGLWDTICLYFREAASWVGSFFGSTAAPAPPGASAPAPAAPAAAASAPAATPAVSATPPAQPAYVPQPAAFVAALVNGKLTSADGSATAAPGPEVRYFAIYYSAQWCPPCHAFSPKLVKWYNAFKPSHPNFVLIFVSEDHDEASMFDYMKEMAMPWPAVRFGELRHDGNGTFKGSGIEQYAGNGIPDLVLVDAGGSVLSDSYQNGRYVGPETVVDDINRIVGGNATVPLDP